MAHILEPLETSKVFRLQKHIRKMMVEKDGEGIGTSVYMLCQHGEFTMASHVLVRASVRGLVVPLESFRPLMCYFASKNYRENLLVLLECALGVYRRRYNAYVASRRDHLRGGSRYDLETLIVPGCSRVMSELCDSLFDSLLAPPSSGMDAEEDVEDGYRSSTALNVLEMLWWYRVPPSPGMLERLVELRRPGEGVLFLVRVCRLMMQFPFHLVTRSMCECVMAALSVATRSGGEGSSDVSACVLRLLAMGRGDANVLEEDRSVARLGNALIHPSWTPPPASRRSPTQQGESILSAACYDRAIHTLYNLGGFHDCYTALLWMEENGFRPSTQSLVCMMSLAVRSGESALFWDCWDRVELKRDVYPTCLRLCAQLDDPTHLARAVSFVYGYSSRVEFFASFG